MFRYCYYLSHAGVQGASTIGNDYYQIRADVLYFDVVPTRTGTRDLLYTTSKTCPSSGPTPPALGQSWAGLGTELGERVQPPTTSKSTPPHYVWYNLSAYLCMHDRVVFQKIADDAIDKNVGGCADCPAICCFTGGHETLLFQWCFNGYTDPALKQPHMQISHLFNSCVWSYLTFVYQLLHTTPRLLVLLTL